MPGSTNNGSARSCGSLAERVAGLDGDSIEEFCSQFSPGLRFRLLRYLGPQDVDDHVHECLIQCILALHHRGMRDPARLPGLVGTVCKHHILREYSRRTQSRNIVEDIDGIDVRAEDPDPDESLMCSERQAVARAAIAALGERDREIIVRFYLRNETEEQIRAAMHLTDTQFRNAKHRAKQRMTARCRELMSSGLRSSASGKPPAAPAAVPRPVARANSLWTEGGSRAAARRVNAAA